uniref:Transient receptor potential cation channel subfamily M member 3 n=1 Tax=Magallana gigas TaxID=29159 RepID=K1PW66_MAGGI
MSEPTDIKHGQNKVSVEETWNNIQQNVIEDETKKKENFTRTKETENIKETTREVRSTPTMVFSVIGDSDSFVPKPWPKTVFQTALIEAAKSGGETWILYRGSDEDVSNVVSDAYQQYEDMEFGTKTSGISDPNRHIKLISIAGKKEMSVPIAIIVCEGDIDTITHISEALKNKLPVIIMKGSGKAADLVSDYLDNPSVLRKKANNLFGIQFDDAKYNILGKLLETISERRELIGVFDLDRDDPFMLSSIVGEAVILLFEALKANRCDYVRVLLSKGVKFDMNNLPELYSQTVACQDCKFKDEDCLHMQWILKQIKEKQASDLCQEHMQLMEEYLKAKDENEKKMCLKKMKVTGLVCSAILKKLSTKANNVKEQILSNDLKEHSKIFEKRCIGIMDSMYNENTQHAIELMDDDAVVWGIRSSPLTFAYENFLYDVVAHDCSQKNMNRQWYNNLAPDLKLFFMMLFFLMLVMYSAIVLTSVSTDYFNLPTAQVFEYYLYIWGAGDFIEELISCFGCLEARGRSHRGYYSRMKRYLYDFWNVVDLLSYILLIAALFVRHLYSDSSFTIARRMFALSVLVMYLRFLEVFLIHRKMGPTLIMIKEMLKDLLKFLFIAVFVIFGVGIYYHAILWPDHRSFWDGNWQNWRIWTIASLPYWQLYGDPNLDSLDGSEPTNCSSNYTIWAADTSVERCSQEDWTVSAVGAIYMLFSNLLLINLVIAMFRVMVTIWNKVLSFVNRKRKDVMSEGCFCKKRLLAETMERKIRRAYRRNFQKVMALRNHNKI